MPSAPSYLQEMFEDDSSALDVIEENFNVSKGGLITRKNPAYIPSEREEHALDYLFLEWDYACEGGI